MKLTDNILAKFGYDKLIHNAWAGWILALALFFGWVWGVIVTIGITLASVYKEEKLDRFPDYRDFWASEIGMGMSWIIYLLTFI